jgi:hypothetical protein
MALQNEVDSLEGLPEVIAKEYEKTDSGKFRLKVEGLEDVTGLKKNRDKLLEESKAAKDRLKQLEDDLESIKREKAKGSGDMDSVVKSYEEKIAALKNESAALKNESAAQIATLQGQIGQLTAGETATKLAASLARNVKGEDGKDYSTVDVLEPLIRQRLRTDTREGLPVVTVLDRSGKPTALTVDELKAEFINNPAYSPLIAGSKASGAGNHAAGPSGGNSGNDLMNLPPLERATRARELAAKK